MLHNFLKEQGFKLAEKSDNKSGLQNLNVFNSEKNSFSTNIQTSREKN